MVVVRGVQKMPDSTAARPRERQIWPWEGPDFSRGLMSTFVNILVLTVAGQP